MQNGGFNLQDFKDRISILRVLENFLVIKKEGYHYKALCPFHHEKTPSFVINEDKGFYHCFGCNESGDAIKFIQKLKNIPFKEALEEVAKLENIELLFNQNTSFFNKALNALNEMNAYFLDKLEQNEAVKSYLYKRGLSEEDFALFGLGFIPKTEDFLNFLRAKDFLEVALKLALISKDKSGNYHSIYANRISFAIKDANHKIRGFSSREWIKNAKLGKYINSKNTEVFNKSFLLYNLSNAKTSLSKENLVFLVEGFFDAITLSKLGFKNVVATSGTAFANTHLALLLKQSKDKNLSLIFVPDKDEAGYKSVIRSLKLCFDNNHFNVKIAVLKAKVKDCGEFLQGLEKEELEKLNEDLKADLTKAKEDFLNKHFLIFNAYEFYLKFHLKRCKDSFSKDNFLKENIGFLKNIKNFFVKSDLVKIAAEVFKVDERIFHIKDLKKTEFKQEKNSLLKTCIKTALNNEEFKQSFDFFVPINLLGTFIKPYENFKTSKELTEELLTLLADENVKELKKEYFSKAIKSLLKNHYENLLKEAKNKKDYKLSYEITKKISELNKPF